MQTNPIKPTHRPTQKLEVTGIRVDGCEISGDGESWRDFQHATFVTAAGGFPHIIDLLTNGEPVYVRTKYVDIYNNGTTGLPKTGAVYRLELSEVQPLRQLIELAASKELPPAPVAAAVTELKKLDVTMRTEELDKHWAGKFYCASCSFYTGQSEHHVNHTLIRLP